MLKKVVLIGPENTGKSNLCAALASYFNVFWCPEYARQYLKENGTQYGYEDLEIIARRQLQLEDTMTSQAAGTDFLFIDTNMLVMQVWYEYVYKHCPPFIMEEHISRGYDLYLLCYPDLPWVSDGMREYPDEKTRLELFEIYRSKLEKQKVSWELVSGLGAERLKCAISAINVHFDS